MLQKRSWPLFCSSFEFDGLCLLRRVRARSNHHLPPWPLEAIGIQNHLFLLLFFAFKLISRSLRNLHIQMPLPPPSHYTNTRVAANFATGDRKSRKKTTLPVQIIGFVVAPPAPVEREGDVGSTSKAKILPELVWYHEAFLEKFYFVDDPRLSFHKAPHRACHSISTPFAKGATNSNNRVASCSDWGIPRRSL